MIRLVITTGEPAGVGPELCGLAAKYYARHFPQVQCEWIGDTAMLQARGMPTDATISHVALCQPSQAGQLSAGNAPYVLATLDEAIDRMRNHRADAMVTAPVHKAVINEGLAQAKGGTNKTPFFSGHTEYLQAAAGVSKVVMMLSGAGLKVALATTHLPLQAVPTALSIEGLVSTLQILNTDLRRWFGITRPRIAVCGLNPHAGESGQLGREEIELITPAIERLRHTWPTTSMPVQIEGPFAADTLFTAGQRQQFDAILAMYHDQGLAPLKALAFHEAVNVSLGLPWIRSSVDHGTALDLAGTGRADPGSLLAAMKMATEMAEVNVDGL